MPNFILNESIGKLIIRLTTGILILFHGVSKVLNPDSINSIGHLLGNFGLPGFFAYGAYVGEVVAAVMIILGIFTRIGGLLIAVNMVFALLLAHTQDIFRIGEHGQWAIELQMFYLMSGIAIIFLGSGRYAVRPDS